MKWFRGPTRIILAWFAYAILLRLTPSRWHTTHSVILSPGQVVRGTCEVERLLGEGWFAEVYRIKHRFLGRQAMKVFKSPRASAHDIEADIEEALLLSEIKHPNIVEVFDASTLETGDGQFGYFTMTYMPGGTLDRFWRSFDERVPVADAVEVVKQVSRGLAVAHMATPPIVHRDIKPQNILVGFGSDGLHIRISDFGLAKAANPLTLLVSARGTLGFKPPESLDNVDSCAADIWALGTTLYLMLTDDMPFPMLNDRDVGDARRFLRPIRPPSSLNPAVDAGLESIVYRCLAASAEDRYPDATQLLDDLEKWQPGCSPIGPSVSHSRMIPDAVGQVEREQLREEAEVALRQAFQVAKNPARLSPAADLLEEAMSKDPTLRERYEFQLKQWRKGIMHVSAMMKRKPPLDD